MSTKLNTGSLNECAKNLQLAPKAGKKAAGTKTLENIDLVPSAAKRATGNKVQENTTGAKREKYTTLLNHGKIKTQCQVREKV